MKLRYNSPVILTYALICTLVLILQQYVGMDIMTYFTVYPDFDPTAAISYLRLFTHVIGHGMPSESGGWDGWGHLVGNFSFILLLGPILEEKYGSKNLLLMMVVTALVTGILQVLFFDSGLLGASGIVFMMILLSSFTNTQTGIPLTFLLVLILYLGKEIQQSFQDNQISEFAHIIGGILGAVFGFFLQSGPKNP
ncbi:MAG: rhomboid family intramembrane serine protease [Bacteroidota bacterium]